MLGKRFAALACLVALLVTLGASAQEPSPTVAPPATSPAPASTPSPPPSATATGPRPAPAPSRPAGVLLDRSTPRRCVSGFLAAIQQKDMRTAVQYLDLTGLRWGEQPPTDAAEQLAVVLNRRAVIEADELADTSDADGQERVRLATVKVDEREVPIELRRERRGGQQIWLFSSSTVSALPELYRASEPTSWLQRTLPPRVAELRYLEMWGWQWVGLLLALVVALPLGFVVATLLLRFIGRLTKRTDTNWDDTLLKEARGPIRFSAAWLAMGTAALSLSLPGRVEVVLEPVVSTPLILAVGWMCMRAVKVATLAYLDNVPDDQEMNTRGLRTQLVMLRKLSSLTIGLITLAIALMQFEVVRSVGWSLLASAGVAGVALGFAAQKSLGAVIAGLQLSVTQPLRLGDAIVIQGNWGEVEEISLTYVRVKLFDERRLVVPVEKFLTDAFENWSKPGDLMTGIIEIAVDPTLPFAELRTELERLASGHPKHDGRDCRMQVVDMDERRALVRCRVSTDEVGETFQLRCDIREGLLTYLQNLEGGRYLPRQRWEAIDAPEQAR